MEGSSSELERKVARLTRDLGESRAENARLFKEMQARTRELSEAFEQQVATSSILRVIATSPTDIQPVLDAVTESAARLCDAYDATLFLRRGDTLPVVARYGEAIAIDFTELPLDRGVVTARAVLDRVPVHIHDLLAAGEEFAAGREYARQLGFRSILAAPLLREGEAIGALMIRRKEVRPFGDKQIELLKTFTDQAVIAIENVRLFEEVQARNRALTESLEQQTAMSEILRVISRSPTDVQPVFETISESAARLCQAKYCAVFRFDGELIHFMAQHGMSPEAAELQHQAFPRAPGQASAAGRAVLNGRVEQIPDVEADAAFALGALTKKMGAHSVISVPMLRDRRPIGAINLARSETGYFPDRQVELLRTFADQAVIAIENVRLFDEVQARTTELTETLLQQTATADVLKVISRSTFDLPAVLDALVKSAAALCGASYGGIFLRDGDRLRGRATISERPTDWAPDQPIEINRSWISGRVALSGYIEHIPDVLTDEEYNLEGLRQITDVRSLMGVPLLREGKVEGVFFLGKVETGAFTVRQSDLVQTFADQAVIAIENLRLFEQVQARTAELSESLQQQTATAEVLKVISRSAFDLRPVLEALAETATRVCDADRGAIMRRDGDGYVFAANAGFPEELVKYATTNPLEPGEGSATWRAAEQKQTIHIPDVLADPSYTATAFQKLGAYRTMLAVPLLREGAPIGVFLLTRTDVRPFAEKQIQLVATFADQAVIAIENVRLFEEVRARTRELQQALEYQTATGEVLNVISRSPAELQPVLDVIIQTAVRLCEADFGTIARERDGSFVRTGQYGSISAEFRNFMAHAPVEMTPGSITGRTLVEGRVVHVLDAKTDPTYTWTEALSLEEIRTGLGVPLLREGTPIGAIALVRRTVRPFTEKQIELVTTFADQAVIAIENARLFEEVQARTAELSEALQRQTATAEVLQVLSRAAFDLPTVLNTLVESAARLCNATYGGIFLREGNVLRPGAIVGVKAEDRADVMSRLILFDSTTVSGRVALSGNVEHIPDILADPEYALDGAQHFSGTRALLGIPLLREGKVEGVFVLDRPEPGAFTERQIELLQTFADQAVIAIENARLFQAVQHRTEELSRSLEDLRTAQDRLVQTEKLASLGQLTAGIAHEIKNPLNFVNNFSALSAELVEELREELKNTGLDARARAEIDEIADLLKGNLEKVVQHGKRADSIVKNMLLHSRQGSGEHRSVDINSVVEESLNLAYHGARAERQGFNVTIEKSLDADAGDVDLYPQEITRVLLNLISNGFYATSKRKAEMDGMPYEPTLSAATKNLGEKVEIRIRDNGTGISLAVKEKLFSPFFTTKPAGEGTGLGLSLSHDIVVKQHAGTIEVETQSGEFTEFIIVLPRGAASLAKSGGST